MNWAGGYKTLPNMEQIAYQPQYHRRMIEKQGIAVRLGAEVTRETVLAEQPDVVVIATGARLAMPEVDGLAALASGFALTIDQVLQGAALPEGPVSFGARARESNSRSISRSRAARCACLIQKKAGARRLYWQPRGRGDALERQSRSGERAGH